MSSSIRRGTLAATALVLAAATLSACAAGKDAQTLEVKPDNAATSVGDVKIQNVNIITTSDGPSAVTARIFNEGTKDETLTSVTVKGAGERVELSPAKGEKTLTVPAGGSLALGGRGNASAVLPGTGSTAVKDGNAQPITFDLSRTGAVSLRATVVPEHGDYKKFGPTVAPSPSAPSGSPSASPSGSSSASPSEDASGSASPDEEGDAENGDEIEEESASGDHAAGH